MKKISITPSTNILSVLSRSGYSLNSAISDLIDNSITAKATIIEIIFELDGENSKIILKDNGKGMSEEDLINSVKLAPKNLKDKRKNEELGRFGIGLKSATSSFCSKVQIVSKLHNEPSKSILVDYQKISDEKLWEVDFLDVNETKFVSKDLITSGTKLICSNLVIDKDKKSNTFLLQNEGAFLSIITSLENYLSKVFHRFLSEQNIQILINKNVIKPWDPYLASLPSTQKILDQTIIWNDRKIYIKAFVLPPLEQLTEIEVHELYARDRINSSLVDLQGFYVYRERRLIEYGTWLNLEGLTKDSKSNYARISVDIDNTMDDLFEINFLKDKIKVPTEFVKDFIKIGKFAKTQSRNNFDYIKNPRPKKKNGKSIENVWLTQSSNEGIQLELNFNHPYVSKIMSSFDSLTFKKLIYFITKEIPVGKLTTFEKVDREYSQEEILSIVQILHEKLVKEGVKETLLLEKLRNIEPLNNSKYWPFIERYLLDYGR